MILLTGASGYLGREVHARLDALGIEFDATSHGGSVGPACDLTNPRLVQELLDTTQPTCIIHCAAKVPKSEEAYHDFSTAWESCTMVRLLAELATCSIVFASSLTAIYGATAYADGKRLAEQHLGADVILRLPGLFGLPRRAGVIYESAVKGDIKDRYGPYPAMHVADAAEYLVRAALMPSDGHPEPFSVTYGDARLEAVYGSLGVTFQQRVQELVEQVREYEPTERSNSNDAGQHAGDGESVGTDD